MSLAIDKRRTTLHTRTADPHPSRTAVKQVRGTTGGGVTGRLPSPEPRPTPTLASRSTARARHTFESGGAFRAFTLQGRFAGTQPGAPGITAARSATSGTASVDEDAARETAEYGLNFGAESFASGLSGQPKAQRIAAVNALLESGSPNIGYALLVYGRADRYQTGQEQRTVAGSLQDAYASGDLTDAELEELASTLSPVETADFSAMLAADPRAAQDNGIVEAWGEITQDLASSATDSDDRRAYEQASAIAFSASNDLIDEHLTTTRAREAALEDIETYLDDRADLVEGWDDPIAEASGQQNQYANAFAGALRLSADGEGWSDRELTDRLEPLGPAFAQDLVGRLDSPSDQGVGEAVDRIGVAAGQLATRGDEDDRAEWQLTQDVAWTQSNRLIEAHLQGQAGVDAFYRLEDHIDEVGDTHASYESDGIDHPSGDAAFEGATRLFREQHEQIVTDALDTSNQAQDEARLARFFQNTLFSPNVSSTDRGRVEAAISDELGPVLADPSTNAVAEGMRAGQLLGLTELAAREAIDEAGDDEEARAAVSTFAARFFGKVAGAAGVAFTGNIFAGFAADAATSTTLDLILSPGSASERRAALEAEYRENLAESGGDPYFAQTFLSEVIDPLNASSSRFVNERIAEIDAALANPNLAADQRQALTNERNELDRAGTELNQLYDNLGISYHNTIEDRRVQDALESLG